MKKGIVLLLIFLGPAYFIEAQSPDSRICSCFAAPVADNFMQAAKAVFGSSTQNITLDAELKPLQLQPVSFQIPALPAAANCKSWYSIYVADDQHKKVLESASTVNIRSFTFPDCNRTYTVRLMAYAKSANGGDGNCSRRIEFKVTPQCASASCNCSADKNSKAGTSMDVNIAGRLECGTTTATQRRYILKFDIVNKSDCIVVINSITTHGQIIEVPAFSTPPKSSTKGISLGFSTPLSQPVPSGTNVGILVRYSIAGKDCTARMDLPFVNCK